jgi:starvation-inducible DNA-binding protein
MTGRTDGNPGADELQRELRDLLCLAVVGDHVRWVVTGNDGAELADWLADAVPRWRGLADRVAKHLTTLGVPPDGRVRSLAKDIPLNWVPGGWLGADEARRLLTGRLHIVAAWTRQRRSQTVDRDTAKLLDAVGAGLERSSVAFF